MRNSVILKQLLLLLLRMLAVARLSYPLYLIHWTLVPLALALTGFRAGDPPSVFLGYLGVFLSLSFGYAFVLHFVVEKPFLLLKDWLWSARPDAARRRDERAKA